jgi:hypothetical protein
MSRDNRIKAIRLMLSDSLARSGRAEYCVVITFSAKVSAEGAQLLGMGGRPVEEGIFEGGDESGAGEI